MRHIKIIAVHFDLLLVFHVHSMGNLNIWTNLCRYGKLFDAQRFLERVGEDT